MCRYGWKVCYLGVFVVKELGRNGGKRKKVFLCVSVVVSISVNRLGKLVISVYKTEYIKLRVSIGVFYCVLAVWFFKSVL